MKMSNSEDFPVVFNIGGSSRHDVMFINPGYSIKDISEKVESLAASSVNCEEPLAKYKKKGEPEKVSAVKVCDSSDDMSSMSFNSEMRETGPMVRGRKRYQTIP